MIERVNTWLIQYGAKGDWIPTLFDLPEMWRLNATRFTGFNLVFCWAYVLVIPVLSVITALALVETVFKWKQGKPRRDAQGKLLVSDG